MRNTKQRQFILDFINHSYSHPTAQEVYNKTRETIPNISLGTVYRLLNKLVLDSEIKRIKMPDNIDRYDRINDFHAHFLCYQCNKIYDLNDFDVLNFKVNNHIVMDYEINLKGLCQDCKEGNIKNGTKR